MTTMLNVSCSLLLVDDDEEFLEIVVRRFVRRGLSVVAAGHPQAALEAAAGRNFHVAIVDRTLPGGDGLHLMAQLKGFHPHLQVIVLSGRADGESARAARDRGAFEYLVKPCSLAELEATVQRAFERTCEQGTSECRDAIELPGESMTMRH